MCVEELELSHPQPVCALGPAPATFRRGLVGQKGTKESCKEAKEETVTRFSVSGTVTVVMWSGEALPELLV